MKKKIYYTGAAAVVILMMFAAYYTFRFVIPTRLVPGQFETAAVGTGPVMRTLEAQGSVVPENEVLLRSTTGGVIERILNSPGSHVKAGEVILLLDSENLQKEIENAEDQLAVMRNNLRKNRLNARSTRVDLDYNVETRKLKIASIKSELADQEELLEVGGISPARIAKTRQELVMAEKELETIQQKNSIRLQQLDAEEEGLQLQIRMKEKEIEDKKESLREMIIKAPSAGIVLNIYGKEGEKFNPGELLVQMSDMTSFKISASIDEQYADVVKTGGRVYAWVDNEALPGQIGRVLPVIENNKVNFEVFLEESSNPSLIPNLKIELNVVTSSRDSVLRVPRSQAFDHSERQNMFVVNGNKALRREVITGLKGTEYIEILSGLQEGDRVITSDVSSFRHMKEIEIEN